MVVREGSRYQTALTQLPHGKGKLDAMSQDIGALILITFEEFVWRNFLTVHAAALGLIIVVLVLFLPNGILPLLRERFARERVAA